MADTADVDDALDAAGLTNEAVRDYVRHWAEVTGADRIEVVSAADDARLVQEALDAGEILPAGEGRYYSRSYYKDTARSEERTIVATSNESDEGVYNNWRPPSEMKPLLEERMRGAARRQDDVRHPLPDVAPGLAARAVRRRRRAHRQPHRRAPHDPDGARRHRPHQRPRRARHASCARSTSPATWRTSARARRTTSATSSPSPTSGRSCTSGRRTAATRCSARSPTACGRPRTTAGRRASSSSEQFMLIGITDKETGKTLPHLRRLPERVGQDQPGDDAGARRARRPLPRRVLRRRHRLAVGRADDGRLYGMNPEIGVFGVAKDTNEKTNPTALESIAEGTQVVFTNVAYNEDTHEVWWEGKTPAAARRRHRLARLEGREDLRPRPRATTRRGPTRTAASRPRWPTSPTSPRTSRTRRASRSTASSSAAAPATASR